MKEVEVAKPVVDWLTAQGWDVYQEVDPKTASGIADIVAVSGGLTWIIECKTSMSLALLEQAMRWKPYGNYVSVATPWPKRGGGGRRAAESFLRHHGIGKLSVKRGDAHSQIPPHLNRRIIPTVRDSLNDHQKTYAMAGNADGRRWTPFQQTCVELLRVVKAEPGLSMKEVMGRVKHHYCSDSTARSTIARYLTTGHGIIKGVEARKEGRFLRLYPS